MDYENRINNLWNRRIQPYGSYKSADKMGDGYKGRAHGRKGVPGADEDAHPYHDELVAKGRMDLTSFDQEMEQLRAEMEAEENRWVEERGELVGERRDEVADRFGTKVDALEQALGPSSSRHAEARRRAERAEEERQRIESDLGRGLRTKMVPSYPLVFLMVALLEVPINRYAFEYFFEETAVLALLLALGFGFAFAAFAHWTGMLLKHATGEKRWKNRTGSLAVVAGILVLGGTAVYFLALMRERYIQFQEESARGLGELLAEHGLQVAAVELLSTELTEAGGTLLLMNLVVFVVGAFCAYQRHDPDPHYEGASKRARKAGRKHTRFRSRYERRLGVLTAERDGELQRQELQAERVGSNLIEIEKAKGAMRDRREQAVKAIAVQIHRRLQAYELANRLARDGSCAPGTFGRYDEERIRTEIASAGSGSGLGAPDGDDLHGG